MIGHQAIGGDADLRLSVGLRENLFKCGIVRRFFEQPGTGRRAGSGHDRRGPQQRSAHGEAWRVLYRNKHLPVKKQPLRSKKTPDHFVLLISERNVGMKIRQLISAMSSENKEGRTEVYGAVDSAC